MIDRRQGPDGNDPSREQRQVYNMCGFGSQKGNSGLFVVSVELHPERADSQQGSFGERGDRKLKKLRGLLRLLTGTLLTVGLVGCGTSQPSTVIGPTASPLVAQYDVSASHSGLSAWVEFGPDTTYGRQTSVNEAANGAAGEQITILVAGMKPQTTYHMRAHVNWSGGSWVDQDHTFTTGAVPKSAQPPKMSVVTSSVAGRAPAPGVELFSFIPPAQTTMAQAVVSDLQGNMIWYCPGYAFPVRPMQNGHFIINHGTDLQEVDLACNSIRDVTVAQVNQSLQANGFDFTIPPNLGEPGGAQFHHDVLVLPNGHWIGLCQIAKSFTDLPGYPGTTQVAGDALVDIDPTGKVVWAWNSFDYLDVNRHPYWGLPDWTHSNALIYTEDGNLLISMRAQSWILKIDYANGAGSGNILWTLGQDGNFSLAGGDPQWFYSQHYPSLVSTDGPQMSMAVWDNGNYRIGPDGVKCGSSSSAPPCYSRATIFSVDESTNIASLLWQDLPGAFSLWGGSIGTLSNGDVEFDLCAPSFAPASQILEVTQTDSPQTVWQMNITGENAYRGYRIPSLYPGVTWKK
jgi:arylsulfate sulfotransferase